MAQKIFFNFSALIIGVYAVVFIEQQNLPFPSWVWLLIALIIVLEHVRHAK